MLIKKIVSEIKSKINFNLTVGINKSEFLLKETDSGTPPLYFGEKSVLSYGAQIEYLLPFNRNKLDVFVEGNYSSLTLTNNYLSQHSELNYNKISVPLALSYRFNINDDLKLFVRGGIVSYFNVNDTKLYIYNKENKYGIINHTSLLFMGGVEYKRLSAEFRVYPEKNITQEIVKRPSKYNQFSIKVSYTLFSKSF